MKKVVLVAGTATGSLKASLLKQNKVEVVKSFEFIDGLIDDLFENGSSDYLDIDSIVLAGNGLLPESVESSERQLINLQSTMNLTKMRSKLYFMTKDSSLSKTFSESVEDFINYRYFMLLVFKRIDLKAVDDTIMGRFDSQGVSLPDFFNRSEIEQLLKLDEEPTEDAPKKVEAPVREVFDNFVDSEKNMKEIRRAELEEKKRERKQKLEEKKAKGKTGFGGLFGKKSASKADPVVANVPVPEPVIEPEPEPMIAPVTEPVVEPVPVVVPEVAPKRERLKKEKPKKEKKEKPKREKPKPKKEKAVQSVEELSLTKGVVIVTGDRQSGVSTTVANMADVYAQNGLSVLVLDLDMRRRTQTRLFPGYRDAEAVENRVKNALLVNLVRPDNLVDVHAVVADNIAVVSLSQDVERVITKFASRPIETVFNSTAIMNLLSFAKSMFDVVLVDFPLDVVREVGDCLSYSDRVVLCLPNTESHLDNFFETEMEDLLMKNHIVAHTLMTKAKVVLTQYNDNSRIDGREASPEWVEELLNSLEDVIYHVEVVGAVSYSEDYTTQFAKDKRIVSFDSGALEEFEEFMSRL